MQTQSKFFDDIAKMASGALSAASGLREEINQLVQQQFDRFLADRDLVSREEFEAVEEMAAKARREQEALSKTVAALEKEIADLKAAGKKTAAPAAAKAPTRKAAPRASTTAASRRKAPAKSSKSAEKPKSDPKPD